MGKEKAGFLTPKAIANRIKSKGLQKLRWYCQMCQKQCRYGIDEESLALVLIIALRVSVGRSVDRSYGTAYRIIELRSCNVKFLPTLKRRKWIQMSHYVGIASETIVAIRRQSGQVPRWILSGIRKGIYDSAFSSVWHKTRPS